MTYNEFCGLIAPSVLELENECRKMNREEFVAVLLAAVDREEFIQYRDDVMQEAEKQEKSKKFMTAILDMIYKDLFAVDANVTQEVA